LATHRPIVATSFRAAGLVIGIPSVALFVVLVAAILSLRLPPLETSGPVDIGTYGLVGLLLIAARGIAGVLGFFISALDWAVTLLAAVSFAAALFGLCVFAIGRGLERRAMWARVLGVLVVITCLGVTLTALTVLPRDLLLFDWLLTGVLTYSLWVMVGKFD
jgi:hypothetical protein